MPRRAVDLAAPTVLPTSRHAPLPLARMGAGLQRRPRRARPDRRRRGRRGAARSPPSDGAFAVAQVVTDAPDLPGGGARGAQSDAGGGRVRTVLTVTDGRAT